MGPKMPATLKLMGRMRKALDWYLRSTVISEIMVRMMPTRPLTQPANTRQNMAVAKVVENP